LRRWRANGEYPPAYLAAIDVAERFADRHVGLPELKKVHQAVLDVYCALCGVPADEVDAVFWDDPEPLELWLLEPLEVRPLTNLPLSLASGMSGVVVERFHHWMQHCAADLWGIPFRARLDIPPALLAWNGGTVPALARWAYDERHLPSGTLDNAPLAVLADALEDSGCGDPRILTHLRSGWEHYRGCFVVDALLGLD
jgi:hypothetical protein